MNKIVAMLLLLGALVMGGTTAVVAGGDCVKVSINAPKGSQLIAKAGPINFKGPVTVAQLKAVKCDSQIRLAGRTLTVDLPVPPSFGPVTWKFELLLCDVNGGGYWYNENRKIGADTTINLSATNSKFLAGNTKAVQMYCPKVK